MNPSPQKSRIFYGWYILVGCFFLLFFQSGARHSFGVMFKPMIAQLGWDRASISLAFFLNMTLFAITLTVAGRFYDRYGPRWVIFISAIFMAAGYISMSRIESLWEFYLYYGIIAAIGVGGASVPLVAAVMSKWFEKRRGLTISLALTGNCIGQFVLVPLFTEFVLHWDWRASYLLIGFIILVVNTILAFGVIKGDPQDFGLQPQVYPGLQNRDQADTDHPGENDTGADLGLREALGTYSFWLFLAMMFICGSGDFLVSAHIIPMVTDYDFSPQTAGYMLAGFGLMSMGGILIAGPVSDLIGNKIPIAITFILRIGLFVMILKYQNLVSFYVFALLFGFTFLITAPLTATLAGKMYGFTHVGLLSGFITTIHHFGGGFWAYMGGLLFDRTGSYRLIFILSAILASIALVCTVFIKEERHEQTIPEGANSNY
ncbi:MAG: MFS transporter [Deltaproteobacteria bacterium]|nr:MFS transporter [Deltaproteobacteria bacterium]